MRNHDRRHHRRTNLGGTPIDTRDRTTGVEQVTYQILAMEVKKAYRLIRTSGMTEGQADQLIAEASEPLRAWLRAEDQWKSQVQAWLTAEHVYESDRKLRRSGYGYRAELMWNAMRRLAPNLDNCGPQRSPHKTTFWTLGRGLRNRYAYGLATALGATDAECLWAGIDPPPVIDDQAIDEMTDPQ